MTRDRLLQAAFTLCAIASVLLLTGPAQAQVEGTAAAPSSAYQPLAPVPLGDTLLSLPTSHIPSEGTWEVKFTHRFNQSIDQGRASDRLHSLYGLDSNADVSIGLSYSPMRDLQFSVIRSNVLDDIETAVKYVVVQQARAIPFSVAVRAGGDWRTERDVIDRTSAFAQAIVSRQFGTRLELFAVPTWVTNAGRKVDTKGSTALFSRAANIPLGAALMIQPGLSVVTELIPPNRDLPRGMKGDIGWAVGLKRAIGGHYFEVLLTNSNATHADQYVTSTYQGSPLSKSDIHLGFNIERRFGRRTPRR